MDDKFHFSKISLKSEDRSRKQEFEAL